MTLGRMRVKRFAISTILILTLLVTAFAVPKAVRPVQAQATIALTVSVPALWENTLTPDLLAEFESQYPGVKVYLTFTDTGFFGFGGASDISTQLDNTQTLITTADVLYIDPTTLTTEDTQAGYFLDLSPLVMSDPNINPDDFYPAVWQSYQWDNAIWALPLSTDVILVTYDQAAFDNAGLAYPNERWTIDDFANAARALTQYNSDGTVATPGMTTSSGGSNLTLFLRALLGSGLYDTTTMPNAPQFSDPALEPLLETWYQMEQDGVVASGGGGGGGGGEDIPLTITGVNGYSSLRFRPGDNNNTTTVRYASLLPGGVAGLTVQGFAVSAGTQYPDQAYALARFLTERSELASNQFSVSPARYSLAGTAAQNNTNNTNTANNAGGPGGPGGFNFNGRQSVSEEIQPVVDQGLTVGLPVSELRYASYLTNVLNEMTSNGLDAFSALQLIEAQAVSDEQTAQARNGSEMLYVTPPEPVATLAPGEIALNCALNQGFGGRGPGSDLPNQDQWDQVIADFVASDPQVGAVNLTAVQDTDLATLAESYDCIILPSNVVQESDLSTVLNLDPLIDLDPTFDRNDVIGNTLAQLQVDNKTWALPLAIEPAVLEYNQQLFAQAGVPEPINGWTVDQFNDALRMLKPYDTDPTPFVAVDPLGSYLMLLIGAYGGLPVDYRTDPPTINFTDPTTEDAIRQVLDLAANGYISYSGQSSFGGGFNDNTDVAITTSSLNQFRGFRQGRPGASTTASTMLTTTYPQGQQYGVVSYTITTGYISASAQNPEAAYGFLSEVSRNPQLFSGMPVRQSLVNDPTVAASQGATVVQVYQQLDALLRSPNTIVFPAISTGGGAVALDFIQEYWLKQAFDNYVLNGSDLDYELSEAQNYTLAYMDCVQGMAVDTSATSQDQQRALFDQIRTCATSVDPTFVLN